MYELLTTFRELTGFGVLCNTSLNFNGKGFINNMIDLDAYTREHGLDGFVVDGKVYAIKTSDSYQKYLCERDGSGEQRVG
jgi:predicted NodU family carbamoyl transferase